MSTQIEKSLWKLLGRLEAWIPALATPQEAAPITTMQISIALMQGRSWFSKLFVKSTIFLIWNIKKYQNESFINNLSIELISILNIWIWSMSRSATGAVDPDTCKLIGDEWYVEGLNFHHATYFFVLNMYTIHVIYQSDISRGHLHLITGYYRDGVPVYGLCKDSSGMVSLEIFWHFILQFYYFWKNHRWWAPVTRAQVLAALQWHMFVSSIHLHPTATSLPSIHSLTYKPYIHVKYLNKKHIL